MLSGYNIVLFTGIEGGVFDPGGETIFAARAFEACDRVLLVVVFPALRQASVS